MNAIRTSLLAVGALSMLALPSTSALAAKKAVAPGQICASTKKKLAGKETQGIAGCDAKAVGKGVTPDPDCKQKAQDSFSAGWAKIEGKISCFTSGDKLTIQGKVVAHVTDLETTLQVTGAASKCSSAKFKDASKKAACLLGCHATAQKKGVPLTDPKIAACLQKCRDKFEAAFTKDETKGDCHTFGDAATVEAKVEAFVTDVAGALPTGVSSTTLPPPTTTTTTLPFTTLCCQATGACLDAVSTDAPTICTQLHGTIAPAGQQCNATTGLCGATKDHGVRCCQCPEPSPPFPNPHFCFESATSTCGAVCTRVDGGICGPLTQSCGGS